MFGKRSPGDTASPSTNAAKGGGAQSTGSRG